MIPNVAHLVWMGGKLPFYAGLAIRTAALRGGFNRVLLHHTDPLVEEPWWQDVFDLPGVRCCTLDPSVLLSRVANGRPGLMEGYFTLTSPANRSDLLRAALLYLYGGVYLDTDVIVLHPFGKLLGERMFLGANRSVYDYRSAAAGPFALLGARLRSAVREGISRLPAGHWHFRRIQRLYPEHPTTGIWGSASGHPMLGHVLDRTATFLRTLDLDQADYNAVGPFLVQRVLSEHGWEGVLRLSSDYFYPLPPVIARRWFTPTRRPRLDRILSPRTLAVHWYASGDVAKSVDGLSFQSIRNQASRQLFSAMVLPFLPATD